ncbi:hypothetical protein WDW86_00655 [Bdellovibrionota bacterium FG-2]
MQHSVGSLLLCSFFLLTNLSAFADHIFVEPTTGTGVSADDLLAVTDLIGGTLTEDGKYDVVTDKAKADFSLRPKLTRLGGAIILGVSKVKDNKVIFSSQLKASQIDELDKVAHRVTQAVLAGNKAASDTRVGETTDQEAKEGTQRKPVIHALSVGLGGVVLGNLNTGSDIGFGLGGSYGWDLNRVRIKFNADGAWNQNAVFLDGGIGLNLFLLTTDFAPYLSGDFGLAMAKTQSAALRDSEVTAGFMGSLGAGVEIFRTSSVSLDLGLRFGMLLKSNAYGSPQMLSARVGVYF